MGLELENSVYIFIEMMLIIIMTTIRFILLAIMLKLVNGEAMLIQC